MAHLYVTTAEVKTHLSISGSSQDALIDALIDGAESLFNSLIGTDSLISSAHTEDFDIDDANVSFYKRNRLFYLGAYKPTAVTTVNGVSAGTLDQDYIITGNTLELKETPSIPTTFPYRIRIVYTAGINGGTETAGVPADIKLAIKTITGSLYNTRKADGIASFKQDLLSVNYKDENPLDTLLSPENYSAITLTARKYTVFKTII